MKSKASNCTCRLPALAVLAAANIYVAQNFPEGVWVKFKVFGITAAMLVFMIPQVIWLNGKVKPAQSGAAQR